MKTFPGKFIKEWFFMHLVVTIDVNLTHFNPDKLAHDLTECLIIAVSDYHGN